MEYKMIGYSSKNMEQLMVDINATISQFISTKAKPWVLMDIKHSVAIDSGRSTCIYSAIVMFKRKIG